MKGKKYMKKTKIIALLLLVCTVTLMFTSCTSDKIDKPKDTNLEYWILDKLDTDGCTELSKGNKVYHYLAKGYEAETDENGNLVAPEAAVTYLVRKYPYRDWGALWRISCITITDPNVFVWGLNKNSTREEFISVMTDLGFELKGENEKTITYSLNRNIINLCYGRSLQIWYNIPMFGSYFL